MSALISFKKLILSLLFLHLFLNNESFSQGLSIIDAENFSTVLENEINREESSDDILKIYKNSINIWENRLNDREKELMVSIINSLNYNNNFKFNFFLEYFNLALNNNLLRQTKLESFLYYYSNILINQNLEDDYFKILLNKIENNLFVDSPSHKLYNDKSFTIDIDEAPPFFSIGYSDQTLGAVVFVFSDVQLSYIHEYGSFTIKTNQLKFYPDLKIINGQNGEVDFPFQNSYIQTEKINLKNYSIDLNNGKIISNSAQLFSKNYKKIVGSFNYDPLSQKDSVLNQFSFQSSFNDNEIIINDIAKLISGITITGNNFSTSSKSGKKSKLIFLLKENKKIIIKSNSFLIKQNEIFSFNSRFTYLDESDSLYHPSLELKYITSSNQLQLFNLEGSLKNTPFYSTFFDVEIISDYLYHTPGQRLMSFGVIMAPDQRPVGVKSLNYFSEKIINELTDLNGVNILKATYNYVIKNKRLDFFIDDLSYFLKTRSELIRGGVLSLWRQGFIDYNSSNGLIQVLPKTRHYFLSHLKRSDFDEYSFNSISQNSNNIKYDIQENKMYFEGVDKITLSKKNRMELFPRDGKVELNRNRNLKLNGDISVGNFDFIGVDLLFDYNSYKLDLIEIDTLKMVASKELIDNYNYLYNIGGDLLINSPRNRSSLKLLPNYPYFVSDKSTKIFFSMPDDYGYEHDSSFYFSIDQFRIDSLDKATLPKFEFPGTFYSNNIFDPLEAKLVTMPDNSFGFDLDIDKNGVSAYKNKINVYENIKVDSTGLYASGSFNYNQLTIFSDKIRLFPDSASGFSDKSFIYNGYSKTKEINYPDMELSNLEFSFYNSSDDFVHIRHDSSASNNENSKSYFSAFDKSMEIVGDLLISNEYLKSEGKLLYNNSVFISDEFLFDFKKVNSKFSDVRFNHKLYKSHFLESDNKTLVIDVFDKKISLFNEYIEDENFYLPFNKTHTSMNHVEWDIIKEEVHFSNKTKSNFLASFYPNTNAYSNWSVDSESGKINLITKMLDLNGVDELQISDAYILPNEGKVRIGEDFKFLTLKDSDILLDTINEYHKFTKSTVEINSKDEFSGSGIYEYVNFNDDTFNIPFSEFKLIDVYEDSKSKGKTSFSSGVIKKDKPILMEPGFNFFGNIELYANKEQLLFNGKIIPSEITNFDESRAISYNNYFAPGDELSINISEQDNFYSSSISKNNSNLFFDFFNNSVEKISLVFFNPSGLLSYDPYEKTYLIETNEKREQTVYNGNSLFFKPYDREVSFEGKVNLVDNDNNFNIYSSVSANATLDSMKISSEGVHIIDVNIRKSLINDIGDLFFESIENYGAGIAHDNEQDLLIRLSDIIGNEKITIYENSILSSYKSLLEADPLLNSFFVFPNTKLSWSPSNNSWYNSSVINLSNIGDLDINASMDGFFEITYLDDYEYIFSLFLQPSPELWLYISYDRNTLKLVSSNSDLNTGFGEITESRGRYIDIEISNEEDVLNYVNNFRLKYFNIKEPYNLLSPSDTFLEDEIFKTISDDDDGF